MSIVQIDVVDAIGIDKVTNFVILSIIDDLDWKDEIYHLTLLQEKINTYLSFLESGEVYESYTLSKDRNFEIKIYLKYKLPQAAVKFLNTARTIILEAGFNLSYEILYSESNTDFIKN
jgi:hypothetical protein